MYRITYTQGNGYKCSCCRHEYTQTIDFDTEEEIIEWLSELKACKIISEYEDDDDRALIDIYKIEDIKTKLSANPKRVAEIIRIRKQNKAISKVKNEKNKKESRKKQYDKLKKEFG